jgi:hypothetical protein
VAREDGRPVAVVLGAGLGVAGIVGLLLALYAGFRVGLRCPFANGLGFAQCFQIERPGPISTYRRDCKGRDV